MRKRLNTNVVINTGFAVILIMFVLMTAANIYIINQNNKTISSLDQKQKQTQDMFIMRNAAQERAIMLFQMNAMEDFFERDDLYILFKKEALKFTLAFQRIRKIDDPKGKAVWDHIQDLATLGSRTQNMAAELIYVEETEKATNLLKDEVIPVQRKVISGLKEQRDKQQQYLTDQITYIQELNINAFRVILTLGILAIVFGFIIACYVSSHNKRTSSLELEKKLAEEENIAKTEFLANMSHELRTPIHAILSFSKFGLNKKGLSEEKNKKYFQNINTSGLRLIGLVDNLLDIAKLESGKFSFKFEENNLSKLMDDTVISVSALLETKNLEIINNIPSDLITITCDQTLISQVFINLLSNAIKFSNEGGAITLNASIVLDDETKKELVRFSVKDNGIGIPESELATVFDKFIQSSTTKDGSGGTGLGLAICHEIIESHSGRIWAESGQTIGTCFIFEIPVHQEISEKNIAA